MTKELITFAAFILVAFGAYQYASEPDFAKKCETYMHSNYNKNTQTCEIVIDTPTAVPEQNLNDILNKLLGTKADCTLRYSEIPNPREYPFKQNISAVCNGMEMNIHFKESLNDYSKAFIYKAEKFNDKCADFDKTKSSLIPVLDTYRYDFSEFGTPRRKNLTGYKELSNRNATQPLICYASVHKQVKQPERHFSDIFDADCTVISSEFSGTRKKPIQTVAGICDNINIIATFDNIKKSKQH